MKVDEMRKKSIVLFGAGMLARKLLLLYEDELPLTAVVDNNEALQGKQLGDVLEGFPDCVNARILIQSPSSLTRMDHSQVCVIVAATRVHQESIGEQLRGYGIPSFVDVYDVLEVKIQEILSFSIQKNKMVFQMQGYQGHDGAITEYLLHAFPTGTLDIVWMMKNFKARPRRGVRIVEADDSFAARKELATAHIVFQSRGIISEQYYHKNAGQYYIELKHWSSITLKAFGAREKCFYEQKKLLVSLKNETKLLDYAFVGSDFDERTLRKGLLYDGPCIRVGSPRSDILFREGIYEEVRTRLGISQGVKFALYAPTFRRLWDSLDIIRSLDFVQLRAALAERFGGEWLILLRLHPTLAERSGELNLPEFVHDVSHYDESEELVAAADVMVSDYSSIIFESAFLYRPVFLYAPDKARYVQEERGFLLDYDHLPFPTSATNEELCASILQFDEETYKTTLRAFFEHYGVHEDGHACERAAAFIMKLLDIDTGEHDGSAK